MWGAAGVPGQSCSRGPFASATRSGGTCVAVLLVLVLLPSQRQFEIITAAAVARHRRHCCCVAAATCGCRGQLSGHEGRRQGAELQQQVGAGAGEVHGGLGGHRDCCSVKLGLCSWWLMLCGHAGAASSTVSAAWHFTDDGCARA
jgi:hypothetical protein